MRRLLILPLTFLVVFVSGCKTNPPENTTVEIGSGHFLGTLRLSVTSNNEGREIYFYVNNSFKESNSTFRDISVNPGKYVVNALIPIDAQDAAYYYITKHVEIASKETKELAFDVPEFSPNSPIPTPEEPSLPPGCQFAYVSVERLKQTRTNVAAHLSKAQFDSLYRNLSNIYDYFQGQPPSLARVVVHNVPVLDPNTGVAEEVSLELVPAQINHLTTWLDSTKYDLAGLQREVEIAASKLDKIMQEANSCGDGFLFNAALTEKAFQEEMIGRIKAFRQRSEFVASDITQKLEQAARATTK